MFNMNLVKLFSCCENWSHWESTVNNIFKQTTVAFVREEANCDCYTASKGECLILKAHIRVEYNIKAMQ